MLFGADPRQFMQQPAAQAAGGRPARASGSRAATDPAEEEAGEFVKVVLAETEDVWTDLFKEWPARPT